MEQVKEMLDYIEAMLEVPHPSFGGLPICPFARKARLENKIKFIVQQLDEGILGHCLEFNGEDYEILMIIHPTKDGTSFESLNKLVSFINVKLNGFIAFSAHPYHDFQVDGIYTRREPYPNVQIISRKHAQEASEMLHKTCYYKLWSDANLEYIRSQ